MRHCIVYMTVTEVDAFVRDLPAWLRTVHIIIPSYSKGVMQICEGSDIVSSFKMHALCDLIVSQFIHANQQPVLTCIVDNLTFSISTHCGMQKS